MFNTSYISLFDPRIGNGSLDLYRHARLRGVHNRVHAIFHRRDEPLPGFFELIFVALNDYLIVYGQNGEGIGAFVATLPQEGEGKLLTIGCCTLYRGVERLTNRAEITMAAARESAGLLKRGISYVRLPCR
jgi:hypothetical protein